MCHVNKSTVNSTVAKADSVPRVFNHMRTSKLLNRQYSATIKRLADDKLLYFDSDFIIISLKYDN